MKKQNKARLFSIRCLPMDLIRLFGAPSLLWLRPKRIYASKAAKKRIRGGALLISNHNGFLDPAYIMCGVWYRRQYFVCHQALMETKAAPLFKLAGCCIPIDAKNFNIGSFRKITDSLKEGKVVTLFPEGHINDGSGKMQEFKSGMTLISMQSKCPIVPVYLKPPKHWYDRLRVVIGEPVDVTTLCGGVPAFSQINEITKMLRQREEQLEQLADKH